MIVICISHNAVCLQKFRKPDHALGQLAAPFFHLLIGALLPGCKNLFSNESCFLPYFSPRFTMVPSASLMSILSSWLRRFILIVAIYSLRSCRLLNFLFLCKTNTLCLMMKCIDPDQLLLLSIIYTPPVNTLCNIDYPGYHNNFSI